MKMVGSAKRFEILILRPLQVMFLILLIYFLAKGMWWWLVGCVVGVLYLGIVGSKLHPLQSASDLSRGPTKGSAAIIESDLLPLEIKQMLVDHACTKVGVLLGIIAGVISWAALGWRWYFALIIAWLITLLSGGILKFAFRTIE